MSGIILYFNTAIALAVPILMVSIGVCYQEKTGVYGMGSDSSMLLACFTSIIALIATGNYFVAILVGVLSGGLMSLFFSIFAVRLGTDQTLTGLACNFAVMGLTSSLLRLLWGADGIPMMEKPASVPIPLLSKIPVVGEILFNQPIVNYLVYIIIPVSWWILYRSTVGLKLRAVGENLECADSVGINILKTRTLACMVAGMCCGLGGSILAVQQVGTFADEMTGSKAWMGIIAAYFGGWSPIGATGAAMVFGLAMALEKRIQLISFINLNSYTVQLFPYIAAILVICLTGKNRRHPANMMRFYQKQ